MIEVREQPLTEELKQKIYDGFSQHAVASIGFDEKFEPVAFVAYVEGQFAGAVVAELFWGALHIKYVYVEKEHRGKGLGKKLLEQALEFGRQHKCPFAFVETMSFQAREFYQKMGFILEYTRSGYKHNTAFHYLCKEL